MCNETVVAAKNSFCRLFSESRLLGDSWVNNIFPTDLPHSSIVPVCWGGYEPSVPFQGFGSVDGALFVSDGSGSVVGDVSSADGVLGPVLHQPIEQELGWFFGRLLDCRFGWRASSPQPLKNRHRRHSSSGSL